MLKKSKIKFIET